MIGKSKVYTAEDCGGELFMVCSWLGLDRDGFRELVLDQLEKGGIPEPDMDVQQLELCEWDEDTFGAWYYPQSPPPGTLVYVPDPVETFKEAWFASLYWTYPGVWSDKPVTRMPAELAAEFWDGDGLEPTDPRHPGFHDLMASHWDDRDKTA